MGTDEVSGNWNLDHVWFTKKELRGLVGAKAKVGEKADWPRALVARLARFHLIDSVNGIRYGQRPLYADADVQRAQLTSTVESVEGTFVTLRLEGRTQTHSRKPQDRGCDTELAGSATFDVATGRFTAFELVGLGSRWGGTGAGKSNDRAGEEGRQAIGFTFSLSGDSPAERVPPMYVLGYNW